MKENCCKKLIIGSLILVFAVMLVFNFMTPYVSDDFAHYYGMTGKHAETPGEIIENLKLFRQSTNGRVIAHFFVYLFLIPPKWVFNIVNAGAAALLPYLMMRFYRKDLSWRTPALLLLSLFALWYFMQSFGEVFLWLTGSCNYLWGLCLDMVFLYPFFCEYTERECSFSTGAMCVLGFITGAYSENGATAMLFSAGVLTLLIWIRRKTFPVKLFAVCAFALAGFAFLMLAPATGETRTGTDFAGNFWYIRVCLKDYSLSLAAVYFVLLVLGFVLKTDRRILVFTMVIACAGLLSVLVFIFAAYLPARSFYVINAFLILAILILLSNLDADRAKFLIPAAVLAMLLVFVPRFVQGTEDICSLNRQAQQRSALAEANHGIDVEIPPYSGNTMYVATYDEELSEDSGNWYNDLVARFYGFNSVIAKSGQH